jgi:hypothetical protein
MIRSSITGDVAGGGGNKAFCSASEVPLGLTVVGVRI